ncbi:unnamed protein product [Spirodela intermedia]|uniref:Uncharacterized protein n=1 Tax=Spirodela intermedia TaxID=51605 RepID=A0A7I8JCH1_SPIIN|nr:unnamed protein product [Spirodela intermedia]CAA6667888.1 unnamed protein product [Spirodela intermedia]
MVDFPQPFCCVGLKRRLHGYGPRAYPVLGCLVSFFNNKHRLLDWYTELLGTSPTQTIVVSRLGAVRTVVTANPANVEHILKTSLAITPRRKLASHEFTTRLLRGISWGLSRRRWRADSPQFLAPRQTAARLWTCRSCSAVRLRHHLHDLSGDGPRMPGVVDAGVPLASAFDTASGICASRGAAPCPPCGVASSARLSDRSMEVASSYDTTSSALTWLFWLLSRYPDVKGWWKRRQRSKGSLDYQTLKDDDLAGCLPLHVYPMASCHRYVTDIGEESAFKYPVFQGRPRVCLGKEMAFIQMKYVVVSVLRRFQLRPVSSVEPVFVPLLIAHMAGGLRVEVKNRCSCADKPEPLCRSSIDGMGWQPIVSVFVDRATSNKEPSSFKYRHGILSQTLYSDPLNVERKGTNTLKSIW